MKLNTTQKSGFTLVEIMIVVAIIGLLAAIAIPNFVKARTTAQKNTCIANLKQIEGAVEQWALENKKAPTANVTTGDIIGTDKFIKTDVRCPAGTDSPYVLSTVAVRPTCPNVGVVTDHVLP